jgi:mannitol/fructose-specific phosphotransferase system IIA component (Ntr-type)
VQATNAGKTSVGLAEIFRPESIIVGLNSRTKQGAVAELVHHLVELGLVAAGEENGIVENVLAREKLGSTALYDGIAFPHCRSSVTDRFVGILGIDPEGIPFEAVNGGLVETVFLFLAPLERRKELYEILGRITAIARDKSRRAQLRGCCTPEAAHRLLEVLDRS